ncbi:hypothetical protein MTO96_013917 [Rhipicephalus appendiculatus]
MRINESKKAGEVSRELSSCVRTLPVHVFVCPVATLLSTPGFGLSGNGQPSVVVGGGSQRSGTVGRWVGRRKAERPRWRRAAPADRGRRGLGPSSPTRPSAAAAATARALSLPPGLRHDSLSWAPHNDTDRPAIVSRRSFKRSRLSAGDISQRNSATIKMPFALRCAAMQCITAV